MGLIFNGLDPTLNGENIICDSDEHFLSDSYLLIFYPFGMKNMSFNS
jgi:hypothetical protein